MLVPDASNSARSVDTTFYQILTIEVILMTLVTAAMIFFVIRYSSKKNARAEQIEGNIFLEITWIVIPTLLVLLMFYFGWRSFASIREVPEEVMTVKVVARQWSWLFEYENGKRADVLRAPVAKPVKLMLTSEDVLHSFYVPAFRIKEDCVPGMETYLWFTATKTGSYDIFCAEYCGLGHSDMLSKVIVMEDKEFEAWYAEAEEEKKDMDRVIRILEEKGCLGCHSTDGSKKIGPTFKGIFGRKVTVITDDGEKTITADEDYLEKSIKDPAAEIVKGYQPIMPELELTGEELILIIDYLKQLK